MIVWQLRYLLYYLLFRFHGKHTLFPPHFLYDCISPARFNKINTMNTVYDVSDKNHRPDSWLNLNIDKGNNNYV